MVFDADAEWQTSAGFRCVLIAIGHREIDGIRIATHRKQKQQAEQGQHEPPPPAGTAHTR